MCIILFESPITLLLLLIYTVVKIDSYFLYGFKLNLRINYFPNDVHIFQYKSSNQVTAFCAISFGYQITFLKSFSEARLVKMAVRNAPFWNSVELQVRTTWKKEIEGVEIDFSMNNSLKDNFERNVGCLLVVVGPMIDAYLKQIGMVFKNKLSGSRQNGLLQSSAFYFPWQVYSYLANLAVCYGADIISTKKYRHHLYKRRNIQEIMAPQKAEWHQPPHKKKLYSSSLRK